MTNDGIRLPAALEPYADGFEQLRSSGVYALVLERPDNIAEAWDAAFDVRPVWFPQFRDAARVVYVGAATDVLARVEEHVDGDVRQPALLRVCEIADVYDVWWFDSADVAFERESGIAIDVQNEHGEWYVHQR